MENEEKTEEQLIDELAKMRQNISELTDRLNNTLCAVLGNIGLAKIYAAKGDTRSKILTRLCNAERAFENIRGLIRGLNSL